MSNSFIAVDWGSSNLRVKLVVDGQLVQSRSSDQGIKNIRSGAFEGELKSLCSDWQAERPALKILMSGMIGSREGWVEVPYCLTAIGMTKLAGHLLEIETQSMGNVYVVPGLRHDFPDGTTDVIRGEEVEVFGVLAETEGDCVTVCAPGTHSKWVNCRDEEIVSFRTWFTGEAFDKLTHDSLIAGEENEGGGLINDDCFERGLEHSGREGGLLRHLFLGRTDMLTGRVNANQLPGLISGILIGHEIADARGFAEGALQLIGNNDTAGLYARAFDFFEMPYTKWEQDVHLAGMQAISALQ